MSSSSIAIWERTFEGDDFEHLQFQDLALEDASTTCKSNLKYGSYSQQSDAIVS